jgi:hypothetical protein
MKDLLVLELLFLIGANLVNFGGAKGLFGRYSQEMFFLFSGVSLLMLAFHIVQIAANRSESPNVSYHVSGMGLMSIGVICQCFWLTSFSMLCSHQRGGSQCEIRS